MLWNYTSIIPSWRVYGLTVTGGAAPSHLEQDGDSNQCINVDNRAFLIHTTISIYIIVVARQIATCNHFSAN